jgi:hypothetical protein
VFVPISLWVTMEIVRFVQSRFMQWDMEMATVSDDPKKKKKKQKHKESKRDKDSSSNSEEDKSQEKKGMVAKTSNLNEDLGRVRRR